MCTSGRQIRQLKHLSNRPSEQYVYDDTRQLKPKSNRPSEQYVYDDTADRENLAREKFSQQRQKEMALNLQRQQGVAEEDTPPMQDALVDFLLDVPQEEAATTNSVNSKRTAKKRFASNTNSGIKT